MAKKTMYCACGACGGTGEVGESIHVPAAPDGSGESDMIVMRPCVRCSGTGIVASGHLDAALVKEIKDIKDTVDLIWAKVNV